MPWSSAALITSSSRIEPPGWITAVAPASIATSNPSANGKNASEATTEPLVSGAAQLQLACRILGLARRDARRIDTAHLPGADADGGAVLRVDDGIRLHVLGDTERKTQIGQFGFGRRALGDGLELHLVDHGVIARLHQQSARDGFHRQAIGLRIGQAAGEQQPQVLLLSHDRDGFVGRVRRDDDFGEDLRDGARGLGVERAVQRHDAAERRRRVAGRAPCDRPRRVTRPRRRRTGWHA